MVERVVEEIAIVLTVRLSEEPGADLQSAASSIAPSANANSNFGDVVGARLRSGVEGFIRGQLNKLLTQGIKSLFGVGRTRTTVSTSSRGGDSQFQAPSNAQSAAEIMKTVSRGDRNS